MGMLDRIKRRQFDGFKEFVENMEITGSLKRQQIFTVGVLEDPIFMTWVMRNARTFEDLLELPGSEIEAVLEQQEQLVQMLAKCFFGKPAEEFKAMESVVPRFYSRIKDELSYFKDVPQREIESARYYLVKMVRKLQREEMIIGFAWQLPPMDIFYTKTYKEGPVQIHFDSGVLAAEGEILSGRRFSNWKHYYDTGKLLAQGDYLDGLKAGTWTFYYSNGQTKAQGRYRADLKVGTWKEWDRQGNLTEPEYKDGVKVA
jgi:hypothetical protein